MNDKAEELIKQLDTNKIKCLICKKWLDSKEDFGLKLFNVCHKCYWITDPIAYLKNNKKEILKN